MANKVGRPLKFQSLEILQEKIAEYFKVTKQKEWTITGLALALDTSRETLMNYEEKEEFFDTIKKAKEMVHNAYELDLRRQGRSGDIFALKNFGWSDKTEVDHTSKGNEIKTVNVNIINGTLDSSDTDIPEELPSEDQNSS